MNLYKEHNLPGYAWNTCCWTLSSQQSINQNIQHIYFIITIFWCMISSFMSIVKGTVVISSYNHYDVLDKYW
jgi:hypothetical protein